MALVTTLTAGQMTLLGIKISALVLGLKSIPSIGRKGVSQSKLNIYHALPDTSYDFNGSIDEVGIWSRVITEKYFDLIYRKLLI